MKTGTPFHRIVGPQHVINERPLELLVLLANDYSLNEAAVAMGISISTANQLSRSARDATNSDTTCGAVVYCISIGLIKLKDFGDESVKLRRASNAGKRRGDIERKARNGQRKQYRPNSWKDHSKGVRTRSPKDPDHWVARW